jgi:hypothetical protein
LIVDKLGYNVHGNYLHGREAVVAAQVKATQPRTVLVMDNLNVAASVGAASSGTEIVFRHYMDDEIWKRMTPAAWMAEQMRFARDYGYTLYVLNEPPMTREVVGWLLAVAKLCVKHGYRAVIGNFGVGQPEPHEWGAIAAPLLRYIAENSTLLTLGLHEYAPLLMQYEATRDPNSFPDSVPNVTWLVGRWRFLKSAWPNVPIMITEFGWDRIDAVREWQEPRIGGWPKHAGYFTSRPYWAAQQVGDVEEYAARQVRWAMKRYYDDPQIKAVLLWCLGGEEPHWSDSDMTRVPKFLEALRAGNTGGTVPNPPAPLYKILNMGTQLVTAITGGVSVNVRAEPHTSGARLGTITVGSTIRYYSDSLAEGGIYTWKRLESGGWFADYPGLTLSEASTDPMLARIAAMRRELDALESLVRSRHEQFAAV